MVFKRNIANMRLDPNMIRATIAVAWADSELDKTERKFLISLINSAGFAQKVKEQLLDEVERPMPFDKLRRKLKKSKSDSKIMLKVCWDIIKADKKIVRKEIKALFKLGEVCGFSRKELHQMLKIPRKKRRLLVDLKHETLGTFFKISISKTPILVAGLTNKLMHLYRHTYKSGSLVSKEVQKSTKYIIKSLRQSPRYVTSQVKRVSKSELVSYWKDFIKGLPEYKTLVRSGKIKEIKEIGKILNIHDESLRALNEAIKQLREDKERLKGESCVGKDTSTRKSKSFEKKEILQKHHDLPLYTALFTEGAFQNWIDQTTGSYLHELIGKGAESAVIDSAFGLGHRLKSGHDLAGFIKLFGKEGMDGTTKWFQHMFSDLMSPDGIPLPGASYIYRFLEDTIGVSEKWFVNWTCVSATDIISAGFVLLILARMHKIESEQKKIFRLTGLTFGQLALLIFAEPNPFYIATVPLTMLLTRFEWKKRQLKRIKTRLEQLEKVRQKANVTLQMIKNSGGTD